MSKEWSGADTITKRIVIALVTFGLSLSVLAAIAAGRLFHFAESMVLWSVIPVGLSGVVGFGLMRPRPPVLIWPALGSLGGFVTVTIWSLGPFFFLEHAHSARRGTRRSK